MSKRAFKLAVVVPLALILCGGCIHPNKAKPKSSQQTKSQDKPKNTTSTRTKKKAQPTSANPTVQASTRDTPKTSNYANSQPPPKSSTGRDSRNDISLAQIRDLQKEDSAVFVDARGPDLYAQGHLSGAKNVPAGLQDKYIAKFHQDVQPDELIVVYCSSAMCEAGNTVCDYLRSQGFTNVKVYKPGWAVLAVADVDRSSN